jgi:hypothetical protein
MPDLSSLFPAILATHITLAICLLVPSVLLPFTLRNRSVAPNAAPEHPGRVVRGLSWAQAHGTIVIGAGLALTGIAMIVVLGPRCSSSRGCWSASRPTPRRRHRVRGPAAPAAHAPGADGIETDADRAAGGIGRGASGTSRTGSRRPSA